MSRFRPSPFYLLLDPATGHTERTFRFRTPDREDGFYDEVEPLTGAGDRVRVLYYQHEGTHFLVLGSRVYRLGAEVLCRHVVNADGLCRFEVLEKKEVSWAISYRESMSALEREDPNYDEGRNDFLRYIAMMAPGVTPPV